MKIRLVAWILVLSAVFSLCAYAQEEKITVPTEDISENEKPAAKVQEDIIASVKAKLDIPEYYTNFYTNTSQDDSSIVHYLSWSGDSSNKKDGGNVSVRVDDKGRIIYYSHYEYGNFEGDYKLSSLDYNGAVDVADNYIKKICPEFAPSVRAHRAENYIERNFASYYIRYSRYENGVPYYNNYILAAVSARSKKVIELTVKWDDIEKFPYPDGMISPETAKEEYKNKIGMRLSYYNNYAGEIVLQHAAGGEGTRYINAYTGEITETGISGGRFAPQSEGQKKPISYPHREYISDEPQGVFGYEELERSVREQLKISDKYAIGRAGMSRDKGGNYFCNMLFVTAGEKGPSVEISVEINALTKEITQYNSREEITELNITSGDEALLKAKAFVQRIAPKKFESCIQIPDRLMNTQSSGDIHLFFFPRLVNGLEYADNGISVGVDGMTGKVVSYTQIWSSGLFPSAADTVSKEAVYDSLFNTSGFELSYVAVSKSKIPNPKNPNDIEIRLVYDFLPGRPLFANAKTGELCGIDGKPYKGNTRAEYSDIGGHPSEMQIKTLLSCRILDEGEFFRPDENITQADYLKWIIKAKNQYAPENTEDIYNELIYGYNVLSEQERDDDGEITFENAIKYLIRYLGYTDIAELRDTYKTRFVDELAINPHLIGYAAIAQGLRIVNGNAFTPKRIVTRATAAEIIYNLIRE
ncbi:MAG: hypothetical protein BWY15_00779 [Firmicutes bacterium ADurb.Bin193]|nr:MAG: hypothetical protein BWY15_00779 [Firmicutes bacterium ADurb.Bin193]